MNSNIGTDVGVFSFVVYYCTVVGLTELIALFIRTLDNSKRS